MKTDREIKPSGAAQPISLAPLKFEEALARIVAVKPPLKEAKKPSPRTKSRRQTKARQKAG